MRLNGIKDIEFVLSQPALLPILTRPTKSVIVRHDLSNAKTFLLERVVKTEAPPQEPTTTKDKKVDQYMHPYQQQQFLLQKQQQELEKQQHLLTGIYVSIIVLCGFRCLTVVI